MKMCGAWATAGHAVTLCVKDAPPVTPELDDYAFYGVASNFRLRKLPRPAGHGGGLRYAAALWQQLRDGKGCYDLVYSRDLWGATLAAFAGWPVVYEAHGIPTSKFWQRWQERLFQHANLRRVVVISQALRDEMQHTGLLRDVTKSVVAHDAADAGPLPPTPFVAKARPQIGYVGNLYAGRGVELIAELAHSWPEGDFHIVGGNEEDLRAWAARPTPDNLRFHGFWPPAQVMAAYRRFDVLLMPHQRRVTAATGRSDISRWMSPLKMFEYMATARPIIASALPVLQEVLQHGHNALLAAPDSVAQWRQALIDLTTQPTWARRLGRQARRDLLTHYTWPARAAKVLQGL